MAAIVSINYHDYTDETDAIVVDMKTLKEHGGQWVIRFADLSIFMNPARAKALADAISEAHQHAAL